MSWISEICGICFVSNASSGWAACFVFFNQQRCAPSLWAVTILIWIMLPRADTCITTVTSIWGMCLDVTPPAGRSVPVPVDSTEMPSCDLMWIIFCSAFIFAYQMCEVCVTNKSALIKFELPLFFHWHKLGAVCPSDSKNLYYSCSLSSPCTQFSYWYETTYSEVTFSSVYKNTVTLTWKKWRLEIFSSDRQF